MLRAVVSFKMRCFYNGEGSSLVAQKVKNLPTVWKTWVRSPGVGKIPLEKGMAVFLPGESPWTEEPGGLQSMSSQRVKHNLLTHTHTAETRREATSASAPRSAKRPPGCVLATLTLMVLCGLRPMSHPLAVMILP